MFSDLYIAFVLTKIAFAPGKFKVFNGHVSIFYSLVKKQPKPTCRYWEPLSATTPVVFRTFATEIVLGFDGYQLLFGYFGYPSSLAQFLFYKPLASNMA